MKTYKNDQQIRRTQQYLVQQIQKDEVMPNLDRNDMLVIANLLNSMGIKKLAVCELEIYNKIKKALNLDTTKGWM